MVDGNWSSQIEDTPVLCRMRYDVTRYERHQCRSRPPKIEGPEAWVVGLLAWACYQQRDYIGCDDCRMLVVDHWSLAYGILQVNAAYHFHFQEGVGV